MLTLGGQGGKEGGREEGREGGRDVPILHLPERSRQVLAVVGVHQQQQRGGRETRRTCPEDMLAFRSEQQVAVLRVGDPVSVHVGDDEEVGDGKGTNQKAVD